MESVLKPSENTSFDLKARPDSSILEREEENSSVVLTADKTKYSKLFELPASAEDSETFLSNLFRNKENIINEGWKINENVQGRIISFDDHHVHVECLVDVTNGIFQNRKFPINLFTHLKNLRMGGPVLLKTRMKPGATRIDVYPGEGIVEIQRFKSQNDWDSLREANLDTKLTEW